MREIVDPIEKKICAIRDIKMNQYLSKDFVLEEMDWFGIPQR